MKATSAGYVTAINQDTRTFYARFLYNGVPITGDIRSIVVTQGATMDGIFTPGAVFSSFVDVAIDNLVTPLQSKELKLEIGLKVGGAVEYVSMGFYTVRAPKNQGKSSVFTAVGRIASKLNGLYSSSLTFPTTINAVLAELTTKTGVSIYLRGGLGGTGLFPTKPKANTYTYRTMLTYVTGLLGGFATEDSAGGIAISPFPTAPTYTLAPGKNYEFPEVADFDYTCTGIKVVKTAEYYTEAGALVPEVAFSHGIPNISLQNPFMNQTLFNAMWPRFEGYSYRPGTIRFLGDNRIEPWDLIQVSGTLIDVNHTFMLPALSIVYEYDGGLTTKITAPSVDPGGGTAVSSGPIAQQIAALKLDILSAQDAIINRLKVTDAEITYATIHDLLVTNEWVGTLQASMINVDYINAHFAKIDLANIADAVIKSAMIDSLSANKLTAGTIDASVIDVENIDASKIVSGVIDATLIEVKNLDASKIVSGSIDASLIDVTNLNASHIVSGRINAALIDVYNLDANEITAGSLAADQMAANAIAAINASIETAKISSAKIDTAEIATLVVDDMSANDIVAKIATIDNGFLSSIIANNGIITSALIGEASIADAAIVELNANKITAGTLSVERLLIGGAEGGLLFALNNLGELVSTEVDSLDGTLLTPRTITADKIIAESITANEIAAGTIIGTNIAADTIEAAHIKAGQIDATKLNVGFVDAGLLSAKEGLIGAFLIGNSYIANGTSELGNIDAGQDGSVYVGADGISCGDKFKVDAQGNIYAAGLSLGMFDADTYSLITGLDQATAQLQSGLDAEASARASAIDTVLANAKLYSDGRLNDYQDTVHQFLNFTPEQGLILGQVGSLFNTQITNMAMNFRQGSTISGYVSGSDFHLVKGVIDVQLQVGNITLLNEDGALNFM